MPSNVVIYRQSGRGWKLGAALVAAIVGVPLASLVLIAFGGDPSLWPHLLANVLPPAIGTTLVLVCGVGLLAAVIGTSTAWLVTAYDFPGRRVVEWALLLPLAVPTYIIAYAYLDILHPVGAVQTALRGILGYDSPREFRLPDIRALWACTVLLGLVLYPYVYLTTRALFLTQAANLVEASRMLGTRRGRVFLRVALPLARPAVAIGLALTVMETLNDIGASQFLGVQTLTASIYSTWINRSDMPGAAQISLVLLTFVIALVWVERYSRRRQRYATGAQRPRVITPDRLGGWRAAGALGVCAAPILLGFVIPATYLIVEASKRVSFAGVSPRIWQEIVNTVTVSAIATLLVLAAGLVTAYASRAFPGRSTRLVGRMTLLGYAVPGTVLAVGLLVPVGLFDRLWADAVEGLTGTAPGLLLLGSGAALVLAYCVRFMGIATGGIEAGFSRIPVSLDHASRMLGQTATGTFGRVHLPLSWAALASAGILVFVDCMKELPATLLLRPLNFETLATHLYGEAARGTYEEASIAALLIVAIGILPVIVLARVGRVARRPEAARARLRAAPRDGRVASGGPAR